jgi:hypothetical protein
LNLRSMLAPVPPCPWNTNTRGAGLATGTGTTTIAVRVTPATVNVETCRPGVNLAPPAFVVVPPDADVTAGADVTVGAADVVEVAPDEHAAANTPSMAIVAMERMRTLRIMTQSWQDVVASR